MPCEVTHQEFAGQLTQLIWCGSGVGPRKVTKHCSFCKHEGHPRREAKALCDWPVMNKISKLTELAAVGDVWITEKNAKRGKVVLIENLAGARVVEAGMYFSRRIWVAIPGHKDPYPYERTNGRLFITEAPGLCSAPCCFRHRRHVGPNKDYCMDHWRMESIEL